MPAHRNPKWTATEVAILREHYPLGGIKAVSELLPARSVYSIHIKVSKLGIRCQRPQQDAPKCVLDGDELEEAIRLREEDRWSFERIGAKFGCSESAACNAVMNMLCIRQGFTPAERDQFGRLTPRGLERLRWCLKKGLKGVEIQLRLGVTASCIAEQRRRYNRELKERGKAVLPPPGGGERYSGVKITKEQRLRAEGLFLEGFGTRKVSERSGISKTAATRIRSRLVRRLKRKGECLPGCDPDGKRHAMRDHLRHVPDELRVRCRQLILERVPVRRAALIAGIGECTAYAIRDELKIELGDAMPKPRLPGKVSPLRAEMLNAQAIPKKHLWRFRALVRDHGEIEARRILRAEVAEMKKNRSFDEQIEAVRSGEAKLADAFKPRRSGPDMTLGGIATGQIA